MARILVVEDDVWSRQLVLEVLEYRGHAVSCAAAVPDAREALDGTTFDAVLLDLNIPGGGGELLLGEIRAEIPRMPVIALTGSAMLGDRERLLAAGFSGHVSKPIDVRTFAETIESYIASMT
jgi:CheY-like chemotaxis protein